MGRFDRMLYLAPANDDGENDGASVCECGAHDCASPGSSAGAGSLVDLDLWSWWWSGAALGVVSRAEVWRRLGGGV